MDRASLQYGSLKENDTRIKKRMALRIKKTTYIPLTHNEGSENLTRTGHIESKMDRGSERVPWGACVNT